MIGRKFEPRETNVQWEEERLCNRRALHCCLQTWMIWPWYHSEGVNLNILMHILNLLYGVQGKASGNPAPWRQEVPLVAPCFSCFGGGWGAAKQMLNERTRPGFNFWSVLCMGFLNIQSFLEAQWLPYLSNELKFRLDVVGLWDEETWPWQDQHYYWCGNKDGISFKRG